MSLSLADVVLLISIFGMMGVFTLKLYRLMSALDFKKKGKKDVQKYDYKFLVIEAVFGIFMFLLNLMANLTLLTLLSSWVFKLAVFFLSTTILFFVAELFVLGGKNLLT
jgi:hypothetical protein